MCDLEPFSEIRSHIANQRLIYKENISSSMYGLHTSGIYAGIMREAKRMVVNL